MKLDLFIPLVASALVAVIGWYVAYLASIRRDRIQKRRDLSVQYLIDAYRRIEKAGNREMELDLSRDLESAIADIQLFGSAEQVRLAQAFTRAIARTREGQLDSLVAVLRRDLRRELDLDPIAEPPIYLRWDLTNSDRPKKR